MNRLHCALVCLLAAACIGHGAAATQGSAFTYQGNLVANSVPANGAFDLVFTLYDAASGGAVIGTPITMTQFPVVDGKVVTELDFPGAFAGQQRWLEVSVNGQTLAPRQPVDAVPVAQYALQAATAPGLGSVEVYGTSQLVVSTSTTSYTLVPGLTANIAVPANSVVHVHSDGGIQSTGATSTTYSVVDIGLFVDGIVSSTGGQRRVTIANTSALAQLIGNWSVDRTYTLAPGNHTFEVKAVSGAPGMAAANVSSGSAPQLQGVLTVEVLAASP